MSTTKTARRELPELPLNGWEETKGTLHLWAQIVGKVRMASTAPRNHWWHVTLYVDVRGLTTRRMHAKGGVAFEIDFDFVDHRLVVATNRGEVESFELVDGLSVAEFDGKLHATLAALGIDVPIREHPFRMPVTSPFPEDREHASYDRDAVERFWHILEWTDGVLEEFAGWYCGKTSPVHLFWHGAEAFWSDQGSGSLARLPYDVVRTGPDPRAALLAFFESAYRAGAGLLGWDQKGLESSWCPSPPELTRILAGQPAPTTRPQEE